MNRSLETRVERLERGSGAPDQFYLMWCRPDEDEEEVLRQHGLGTDWHNCCHWKGSGPMPAARWTTINDMTAEELRYMIDSDKAAFIRNGWVTAEELNELEREIQDSPAGSWDSSKSRVITRLATKGPAARC